MATKLQVWKHALLLLGKETITSLTDTESHAIGVFTDAWPGVLAEAFNEGDWNFLKVTGSLVASTDGPAVGSWQYVWDLPDDYMRTIAIGPTADFDRDFRGYTDAGGYIYSSATPMFLLYVSKEKQQVVEQWPDHFWLYVAHLLAARTCKRFTNGSTDEEDLEKKLKRAMQKAKSIDARNENNRRLPQGSWMRAHGGWGGRRDSSLIIASEPGLQLEEGDV